MRLVGDIVRTPEEVDQLASAPFGLGAMVSTQVDRWFVKDALRMARYARLGGTPDPPEPADVEAVGHLFLSMMQASGGKP